MFRIDCCPREWAGDLSLPLELVDFAEKGNLPIEGGTLNQTQFFLDVLRFVRQERARHE